MEAPMCGRFVRRATGVEIAKEFDVPDVRELFRPSFNVAPTDPVLTIVGGAWSDEADAVAARAGALPESGKATAHHRKAVWMRWGLVPSWAKDASGAAALINARGETLATKPSFKDAFTARRCLVVADGFFEWETDGKHKYPHLFTLASGRPFAMAGLWERWQGPEGELVTCTVVTAPANPLVEPFHDRMPVILPHDACAAWLDVETFGPSQVAHLLHTLAADQMREHEVSTRINSVANNAADLLEPVTRRRRSLFD